MKYSYLIGHKVKVNYFHNLRKEKVEYISFVLNVKIQDGYETIITDTENQITIKGSGKKQWIQPFHKSIKDFKIEILDEVKKYTKFTRFEIMEI